MNRIRGSILGLIAVPVLAIGLAACGGSSSNSSNASSGTASNVAQPASASDTVSTKSISGVGTALVDSKGDVLYTNNQDTASKMACTTSCQTIWPALMAPSSGQPTSSDSAVQAKLGVAHGQVTYNGKPLFTFVNDSPGQATGNGFMDSFGGTSFTWTAASTSGSAASSSSNSSSTPASSGGSSSGGSSGGYGY
jgi:predicted lipoprotein with Yx(FWY)xxD motif